MIAFVEGAVEQVREGALVVRAGAWGIEVLVPSATTARAKVGEVVRLHTHLAVRERRRPAAPGTPRRAPSGRVSCPQRSRTRATRLRRPSGRGSGRDA